MEIPVTEREKEITVQYGRRFKVAPQVIACEGWRITVLLSALNSEEIRVCRRPLTGVWDVAENGARAAGSYAITDFALASCDISLVGTACDHSWVEYGLGRELVGLKNCTDEPYTYVFTTVVLRAGCAPLVCPFASNAFLVEPHAVNILFVYTSCDISLVGTAPRRW
eukprot:gene25116-30652_t